MHKTDLSCDTAQGKSLQSFNNRCTSHEIVFNLFIHRGSELTFSLYRLERPGKLTGTKQTRVIFFEWQRYAELLETGVKSWER